MFKYVPMNVIYVRVCTGTHTPPHLSGRAFCSASTPSPPEVFSSHRHGSVAWPSRSRCRRRALTAAVGGTPPAARAQRPR